MKPTIVALMLMVAALALAQGAAAKGPFAVRVCGASGCTTVQEEVAARGPDALGSGLLGASEGWSWRAGHVRHPGPARYYSVHLEFDWLEATTFFYVPSVRALRAAPYWLRTPGGFVREVRALTAEMRPWPAPRLIRVLVGGRRAPDPVGYARLLGPLPPAPVPTDASSAVTIRLQSQHPSPWTDRSISYFPRTRTVYRDSQWLRIPSSVAATIERDAGIGPPAGPSRGDAGFLPWAVVGTGLAALLLAAAAGLALRARRSRPSRRRPISG
jgi:hypothetical protein